MGDSEAASIGSATMLEDGTLVLLLRATGPGGIRGDARMTIAPSDPRYVSTLQHLGGLKPGEDKPVPPWPEGPAFRVSGSSRLGLIRFDAGFLPAGLELNGDSPEHAKLKSAYEELQGRASLPLDRCRHEDGKFIDETAMVKRGDKDFPYALVEGLRRHGFTWETQR